MAYYNYLIVGGGIAGVTAAETVRAGEPDATIAILSKETNILYSRVLLPNYIKGKVRRDQVFLRSIDDFEKRNIDLLLGKEAIFLDTEKKEVKAKSGELYSFDKLLIASGGSPRAMSIPGENLAGVFRLQTIDDADGLVKFLPEAQKAVVIGGGFISLEFLEIMRVYNIPTTLVARGSRFFSGVLDQNGGELMNKNFERSGVDIIFEDDALEFGGNERVSGLRTQKGLVLDGDIVGVGIGLKMNDDFALGTSVGVTPGRGMRTNEFLETATPGIFAAGDIAEYFDVILGGYHKHGNWTNAFLQGRVAGQNMLGIEPAVFKSIPFYSIANLGLHITFLGEPEEAENTETVSRVDLAAQRYERFFLRDEKLVGAVLINMFHDKPALAELIENKIPIAHARIDLADISFDVKTLLG